MVIPLIYVSRDRKADIGWLKVLHSNPNPPWTFFFIWSIAHSRLWLKDGEEMGRYLQGGFVSFDILSKLDISELEEWDG